jgi:hypothetical protein
MSLRSAAFILTFLMCIKGKGEVYREKYFV